MPSEALTFERSYNYWETILCPSLLTSFKGFLCECTDSDMTALSFKAEVILFNISLLQVLRLSPTARKCAISRRLVNQTH